MPSRPAFSLPRHVCPLFCKKNDSTAFSKLITKSRCLRILGVRLRLSLFHPTRRAGQDGKPLQLISYRSEGESLFGCWNISWLFFYRRVKRGTDAENGRSSIIVAVIATVGKQPIGIVRIIIITGAEPASRTISK